MNLFISSDIEGTCGIAAWSETEPGRPDGDYAYFKQQMSREVAAACRGALAAGGERILVKDAHDSARNIDPSVLPRRGADQPGLGGRCLQHDEQASSTVIGTRQSLPVIMRPPAATATRFPTP